MQILWVYLLHCMEPDFSTAVRTGSLPGFGGFLRPGDFANPTPFAIMHVMIGLRPEESISLETFKKFRYFEDGER